MNHFRRIGLLGFAALLAACAPRPMLAQSAPSCDLSAPDIYDLASPSVVGIAAISIDPYSTTDRIRHGMGTGVVIDTAAGLVVTNAHVVMGAEYITVVLSDGTALAGDLIGMDPIYDLAVIAVEPTPGVSLSALRFGPSDRTRVGEDVVAIGHPLGLRLTLSSGVVSSVHRILPVAPFALSEPYIQTDAAINPGNSGGPLLNRCGEVIGINTAAIPGAQNIGFAVPSSLVARVIPMLIEDGRVIRPWYGFHGQMVDASVAALLRIPMAPGLLVEVVEPGSPADQAGLRGGELQIAIEGAAMLLGGDIITAINGRRISSMAILGEALREVGVGDSIQLDVFRLGERLRLQYTVPERPLLPTDLPGRLGDPSAADTNIQ